MSKIKCPNCEELIHIGRDTTTCPECDRPLMVEPAGSIKLAEIIPREEKKQPMSKSILAAIIIIKIVLISGVFGKSCVKAMFSRFSSSRPYSESKARWSRYNLAEIGISIEMPGELKPLSVQLPDHFKSQVLQYEYYQYDAGDISAAVTWASYVNSVVDDTEDALIEAVENIRTTEGVTNLQYSTTPQGPSKTSVRGTFARSGGTMDIDGFAVARGSTMWGVLCINKRDNGDAVAAVNRILASATFN